MREETLLFNCDIMDTLLTEEEFKEGNFPVDLWDNLAIELVNLALAKGVNKILFSLNSTFKKKEFDIILTRLEEVFAKYENIVFTYQVNREGYYDVDKQGKLTNDFIYFEKNHYMEKVDEIISVKKMLSKKYKIKETYFADDTIKPDVANGYAAKKCGSFNFLHVGGEHDIKGNKFRASKKHSTEGLIELVKYASEPISSFNQEWQYSFKEEQDLREFIYECERILKYLVKTCNITDYSVSEKFYDALETKKFYECLDTLNLKERKLGSYSTKDILKVIWYLDAVTVLLLEPDCLYKFIKEIEKPIIGCNLLNKKIKDINPEERYFEYYDNDRCSFILALINEIHMSAYSLVDSVIVFVDHFYAKDYLNIPLRDNPIINYEFVERLINIHGMGIDQFDVDEIIRNRNDLHEQYFSLRNKAS